MARSANEARHFVGKVDPPDGAQGGFILLECLPSRVAAELRAVGLSLDEVDGSTVVESIGALRKSWCFVHTVWPELSSSIGHLVRCLHLLKAPSPEFDCSYTKPGLPFSVFLSVPGHDARARIERVTEALVHETMHLQLSLVERGISLVDPRRAETTAFSPWRGSERNVRGALHALYVFVVVQKLWQRAAQRAPCGLDLEFVEARVCAIRDQVARTRHLAASPGLSREGRQIRSPVVGTRRRFSRRCSRSSSVGAGTVYCLSICLSAVILATVCAIGPRSEDTGFHSSYSANHASTAFFSQSGPFDARYRSSRCGRRFARFHALCTTE